MYHIILYWSLEYMDKSEVFGLWSFAVWFLLLVYLLLVLVLVLPTTERKIIYCLLSV